MVSYVLEGTAGLAVGSPAELPLRLWALFDVRHLLRWQHCVGRRPHVTNDLNCDLLRGALPKEELIRLRSGARAREPCSPKAVEYNVDYVFALLCVGFCYLPAHHC